MAKHPLGAMAAIQPSFPRMAIVFPLLHSARGHPVLLPPTAHWNTNLTPPRGPCTGSLSVHTSLPSFTPEKHTFPGGLYLVIPQ
ncbi:hypothetical protein TNCV_3161421 [Trichonephila clavipes]|nr:hypothetical protein TNCV_3161421 [Trichonephila clavipes]